MKYEIVFRQTFKDMGEDRTHGGHLHAEQRTDSRGRNITRWVRTPGSDGGGVLRSAKNRESLGDFHDDALHAARHNITGQMRAHSMRSTPDPHRVRAAGHALDAIDNEQANRGRAAGQSRGWIDAAPALPKDTQSAHQRAPGVYKPGRAAFHDAIVKKFMHGKAPAAPGEKPHALVMMGGPGSGKSSILKQLGIDLDSHVHIDPDEIKQHIPEYHVARAHNAKNAAFMAHEESSDVAKKLRDHAIQNRHHVLIDGTGANGPKHKAMVEDLKQRGYHVTLAMPHISKEEGLSRVAKRAEGNGRFVPSDVVGGAYDKIPGNFHKVAAAADDAYLFDNHEKSPRLMYKKEGGQERQGPDVHTDLHAQFLAAHGRGDEGGKALRASRASGRHHSRH
jgi:predicted ABC-type ATPase